MKKTILLIGVLLNLVSCDEAENLTIIAPRVLLTGESVEISAAAKVDSKDLLEHNWSSQRGIIKDAEGAVATYVAPPYVTTDLITVNVKSPNGHVASETASIRINKQYVIVLADDYVSGYGSIPPAWQAFIDVILNNNLRAGIGIIAASMSNGYESEFLQLMSLMDGGDFELYCHGYDHSSGTYSDGSAFTEFSNTSYESQLQHLLDSEEIAAQKLNIVFKTFVAPFNQTDDNTARALDNIEDFKVWIRGNRTSNKFVLDLAMPIENCGEFCVNYDAFLKWWHSKYQGGDSDVSYLLSNYILIEVHPGAWSTNNSLQEFKRIIEFLMERRVEFITPFEYYQLNQ